jgi:DNA-binding response OmpR family regulator
MSGRVLVIDDEPDFIRFVQDVLKDEHFTVLSAFDGESGLKEARASHPDVILLDWNLPGKDGLQVCRELKAGESTRGIPVILLTSRGRETDVVLGLEVGADDYIIKRALRPLEMMARVRSAMRKAAGDAPSRDRWSSGGLALDASRREATIDGHPVDLRTKEFDLLKIFLQKKGHMLTRSFLCETVWGVPDFGTSRTIDTTLARLRAKLGPHGEKIQTIKNVGYKFAE